MKNVVVGIIVMPYEIDMFQNTVMRLKESFEHLSTMTVTVDVTLVSTYDMTDWDGSAIDQYFIEDKFKYLEGHLSDISNVTTKFSIEIDDEIIGCVSKRRQVARALTGDDYGAIFLDCDIVFPRDIFYYIEGAMGSIKDEYFTLVPQIIRIWDTTWDVLVNDDYMDWDHESYLTADLYSIVRQNEYRTKPVEIVSSPVFKFAGGWMTFFSRELLQLTDIPDAFGHYGLEDTYVMGCMALMENVGLAPSQYILTNLIVGEDYKYRPHKYLDDRLQMKNRKDEFLEVSDGAFFKELERFAESLDRQGPSC